METAQIRSDQSVPRIWMISRSTKSRLLSDQPIPAAKPIQAAIVATNLESGDAVKVKKSSVQNMLMNAVNASIHGDSRLALRNVSSITITEKPNRTVPKRPMIRNNSLPDRSNKKRINAPARRIAPIFSHRNMSCLKFK